jgi:hypothetical protein
MNKTMLALAALASAAWAAEAQAHGERTYRERHCGACLKLFETTRWERREVKTCEQVLTGYRDEIVGYEDVWVERPVTVYETRTVVRQVFAGYDRCGRPIYRSRPVCERVPVCRTERVCEKRPIVEKRPVYEMREVVRAQWVEVPHAMYVCLR